MLLMFGHFCLLVHHAFAGLIGSMLDFSAIDDEFVQIMVRRPYGFLTFWNMIGQSIYLMLAIYMDYQRLKLVGIFGNSNEKKLPKHYEKLLKIQGYFFHAIIVPYTLFVTWMFWLLFYIDRELSFPKVMDTVMPWWLNHCVHTNIVFLVIQDTIFGRLPLPSHKSALIGFTVYQLVYWAVILQILFTHGKFVYKIFEVLPLHWKICYALANYFTAILFYIIFYKLQKMFSSFWQLVSYSVIIEDPTCDAEHKLVQNGFNNNLVKNIKQEEEIRNCESEIRDSVCDHAGKKLQ